MQTWDLNSLSLVAAKFRFISSLVFPAGGPEGTNIQARSEQPQPWTRSIQIISRAMSHYGDLGKCAKCDRMASVLMSAYAHVA
jgi:hypothetical protein